MTWSPLHTSHFSRLFNCQTMIFFNCQTMIFMSSLIDFSIFSSVKLIEGQPELGWFSADILPPLKQFNHSSSYDLLIALSLKASLSIVTVSAAVLPRRNQNFTHTHTYICAVLWYQVISTSQKKNCQTHIQMLRETYLKKTAVGGRLFYKTTHSQYLAADPWTRLHSRRRFKIWKLLDTPS